MKTTSRRTGFTLIEMLIVLGIIVAVSAIFVPIALNLSERNQVAKGASMLENALHLAKARAVAEKRPNGVRLILASANLRTTTSGAGFAWYDEIQYIEDPSDYVDHWVWGFADPAGVRSSIQPYWSTGAPPAAPAPGVLPLGFDTILVAPGPFTFPAWTFVNNNYAGTSTPIDVTFNRNQLLFGPISALSGANTWNGLSGTYRSQRLQFNYSSTLPNPVQAGDMIEINGTGELYQVIAVSTVRPGFTNNVNISANPANPIVVPVIALDRPLGKDILPSLNGRPNYRIIRQPRVISSLTPVKLPQDVVIDLTRSRQFFLSNINGDYDTTNTIYMSNVSQGIITSEVSGLTFAGTPQQFAPLYIDIMFSPSGEILPTSQKFGNSLIGPYGRFSVGASGLVALWVHQRGDPNLWAARQITAAQGNADNQAIVAVNARTGFIGSYPINRATADPLALARIGKARMSADTGQ